jgi:hypothetical protein
MAITVKHLKVSTVPDAGDDTLVEPSDWNADHTLTGLGTMAEQDASAVAITGGTISGVTIPASNVTGTLGVPNGGTGATTLTGYVKGTGTTPMTASATIPNTDITGLGTASTKDAGAALGVATLDAGGKVPVSELPAAVLGALSYQGTWNASTNTPTLTSSVGTKGYYYVVDVAGTTNLNGITDWQIGDWAIFNGTVWQKVDNTDAVTSVNGQVGTVVLTASDVGAQPVFTSQTANTVYAAPNGSAGVPSFRALVSADIPSLSGTYIPYTGASSAINLNNQTVVNIPHLGLGTATVPTILMRAVGDNNSSSRIAMRGYSSNANSSSMRVTKFRGTVAAPQAPQSGDSLGKFELAGYGTTSSDGYPQASYEGLATEAWGAVARGTKVVFKVTPNTTTTQVIALTIDQNSAATFASSVTATSFSGSGASLTNVVNSLTASTGISVSGSTGAVTVTNTAPDQTVALTSGTGISVTGTYPNFTVTNTAPSSGGTVTSVGGTGTVNGISLSGTVTSSGNLTLGGALTGVSLATQVTGTLPIANGGTGATVANGAMANLMGFTTTATAAGTTTLTNTSSYYQLFTGTTTQTVVLPVTSTLQQGWTFHICNNSTGDLTVQSSGLNTLITIPAGLTAMCTCVATGGTGITDWEAGYTDFSTRTGSGAVVLASSPSITSPTINGSLNFFGPTNTNSVINTSQTSGTLTISGASSTGALTVGQSTVSQTTNIQAGATASGSTKTMNIGTGGLAGSTTNIAIGSTAGTSTTTVNGTLNTSVINATNGIVVNSNTVSASYTIPTGSSAMSTGPMTVASGQTVTVSSGSRWVVL